MSGGSGFRMTDAEWAQWIALFREHPGETVKVAKLMGVPRNRARIAWYHGWPKHGKPAISQLLEQDKSLARVHRATALAEQEDAEAAPVKVGAEAKELAKKTDVSDAVAERNRRMQKLQEDSARTRAQEGMLINVSRGNALALAGLTVNLLKGAQQLSKRLEEQLKLDAVPAREAMSLIKSIGTIVRMNTDASLQVLEMERKIMGDPAPDVKSGGGKLSPDEAADWIRMAMTTMQKYEARKALRRGGSDASESEQQPGQTIVVHAADDEDDDEDDVAEPVGRAG